MRTRLCLLAFLFFLVTSVLVLDSCRKSTFLPATPITFVIPLSFPATTYNFHNNPLSEEGFLLGRRLFYDGRLSKNGAFSCASCHQQQAAFTTFEHDRSHGYAGSHTLRNAPGLFNLAWAPAFLQDGSAASIEAVILAHIQSPTEMAETVPSILSKLQNDTVYKRLFQSAYGNETLTEERLVNALSQFVVSLVSAGSKWDKVQRGEAVFTAREQSGYVLFQARCSTCHKGGLFTDYSYRNIGLPLDPFLADKGRMRVTGNGSDSLKFRVPSLRNIDFTSYYTHDGRWSSFSDVIRHYRTGVVKSSTLDPLLTNGISLTNSEQDNLEAFLQTLSDSAFLNNPRWKE